MPVPPNHQRVFIAALAALNISTQALPVEAQPKRKPEDFIAEAKRERLNMEYEQAVKIYTKAMKVYPNDARFYQLRADTKEELGQYKGAIADLDSAIKLNPREGWFYSLRANLKWKIKNPKGAIADYTEALKIGPNDVMVMKKRGHVYRMTGMYKEAIPDCEKAIAGRVKKASSIYDDLAYSYLHSGQLQKALETYTKMTQLYPDWSMGYYGRAEVYQKLGKPLLAKKEKARGLAADQDLDPKVMSKSAYRD